MREYLFRGWSEFCKKWVYGSLIRWDDYCCILHKDVHPADEPYLDEFGTIDGRATPVVPESVGEWTGMNEFVVSDRSFNKQLFEGDIVEVWGNRSPTYTYDAKSQYDGRIKCRAVIHFKRGQWELDYKNKYNESLAQLKGKETDKREVDGAWELYYYGSRNEEFDREHNYHFQWKDIVKIGTVFENADLLEG